MFAVSLSAIGERGRPVLDSRGVADTMLKMMTTS